eukprot:1694486-Amphidinium_carterae.1
MEANHEPEHDDDHEAEYDDGADDNASDATSLDIPLDQWEHENAGLLNQDQYGFGLEDDVDLDDTRLFDEAGIQPDGFGMIPWDVALKSPVDRDDEDTQVSEELAKELEDHYA